MSSFMTKGGTFREPIRLSPWTVCEGHCAMRFVEGADSNIVANRVAFVEKTARIRIYPFEHNPENDGLNWKYGVRGRACSNDEDAERAQAYGFYPPSREWCDRELHRLGYVLPDRMTDLFSSETKAVFAKRRAELEAHIVSFFAAHPLAIPTHTRSEYEIRTFVIHRLDWVRPIMVTRAIARMVDAGRLVSDTPEDRTLPLFSLPSDPEEPFRIREERLRAFDRHILSKMPLPRFFRIDAKEDLRPSVRTRTGHDARVDFNRF